MADTTIHELTSVAVPLWPLMEQWIAKARYQVTVLPVDRERAAATLLTLNVTTRSPLGTMAYETGGISVDNGWLRLLGANSAWMHDGLLAWNGFGDNAVPLRLAGAFLIAHDVLGGFFATNLGAFGPGPATVFYFAPDSLQWTDLKRSYTVFLEWALTGDVRRFYRTLRWPGCEQEVAAVDGDHGLLFWPMLWTAEPALEARGRKALPQRELWSMQHDLAQQLKGLPPGSQVRTRFTE
jgi:hypothetical protein